MSNLYTQPSFCIQKGRLKPVMVLIVAIVLPYNGKLLPGLVSMGCITEINDHLYEGRWSPKWIDGKRISRNVYATTREESEAKLAQLIRESKIELAELKRAQKKASKSIAK